MAVTTAFGFFFAAWTSVPGLATEDTPNGVLVGAGAATAGVLGRARAQATTTAVDNVLRFMRRLPV